MAIDTIVVETPPETPPENNSKHEVGYSEAHIPPELINNMGRIAKLSPEERRELASKGGKATAGISKIPYVYCDNCHSRQECEHFKEGKKCHLQVEFRKKFKKNPVTAFEMLGLENPKNFASLVTDLLMTIQDKLADENKPEPWLKYTDRLLAFGKMWYGERHTVQADIKSEIRTIDMEKVILQERRKVSYNPVKKEKLKPGAIAQP